MIMKGTKQRIIFTDYLSDGNHLFQSNGLTYALDPLLLFSKLNWSDYEENIQIINQVYSEVFDEIVVNKKSLICHWPLNDHFDWDWLEIQKLFIERKFEFETHKKENEYLDSKVLNKIILKKWKGLVCFILEALLDDMAINDQIDQIATLTNENGSIVLFRMEQNGDLRYSFASTDAFFDQIPTCSEDQSKSTNSLPLFYSFMDMLENLLDELDLISYKTQFSDKQLEKTYYNRISKEFKIKNLIQNWLDTYSLN